MKVYIAGSLFSESQIRARRYEADLFKKIIPKIEVFNPIDAPYNENKVSLPSPAEIYNGDLEQVLTSNFLVFNFEDLDDPGVCLEIGLACANNVKSDNKIIVIGVMSDIRLPDANAYDIPSLGYNHMVVGAVDENGYILSSYDEAVNLVQALSL